MLSTARTRLRPAIERGWQLGTTTTVTSSSSTSTSTTSTSNSLVHHHHYLFTRCFNASTTTTTTSTTSATLSSSSSSLSLSTAIKDMLKLSKHRLSALVAFTAGVGYLCHPYDTTTTTTTCEQSENNTTITDSIYYRRLMSTTVGTWLTAASANTLNQIYERVSDARMKRTSSRPLPSGRVSPTQALAFAITTGLSGLSILQYDTNSIATSLAFANIVLYSGVYTPLKAMSTINTWIGAIVGALPPLIGHYAANSNSSSNDNNNNNMTAAWGLASILFLWQIPHFHALAVALRQDYKNAGLKMLAVSNPMSNALWARRTAALLLPIAPILHMTGVASEPFVWSATLLSAWLFRETGKLVQNPTCVHAARQVFRASIFHLPLCLGLLLLNRTAPMSQHEQNLMIMEKQNKMNNESEIRNDNGSSNSNSNSSSSSSSSSKNNSREVRLHQPWEMMAPFPFLPVPRGAPAIVVDVSE